MHLRPYSNFSFGQPFWIEMIIGAAVALPFSWLRFYLLGPCNRHLVHFMNDLLEGLFFWNELTMLDEGWVIYDPDEIANADATTVNRNIYYILVSNMSMMITIPQLYNQCIVGTSTISTTSSSSSSTSGERRPILRQFIRFTSLFNSHIVEQGKLVEYADTGLRMAFRNEWAIVGVMAG